MNDLVTWFLIGYAAAFVLDESFETFQRNRAHRQWMRAKHEAKVKAYIKSLEKGN